ncbi:MAG: Protein YceI [Steroidobacteraceae bacterium]|nr:Protein YceI [Steroidobacteraceae bacterium]
MPIRNTKERWGSVAKFFHWTIVLLIIGQFVLAFMADSLPVGMQKLAVLARHKSFGITILALAALRLMWRAANRSPVMPSTMAPWERLGARAAHALLYALLFAVPLAGWTMSSAKNFPVSWFGLFQLPDLVAPSESTFETLHEVHEILAFTLGAVAILHMLAALKHHFIDRDTVLRRMLPFVRVPGVCAVLLVGGLALQGDGLAATPGNATGSAASGTLQFRFSQAGAATVGSFGKFEVTMTTAADGTPTALAVTVATDSLDTKDKDRDTALRSSDLFDVKQFPRATFTADSIRRTAGGSFEAIGKLTIRGVTRDVTLPFTLAASAGGTAPGRLLAGELPLKRLDYGIGQGEWRSTEMVGDAVTVLYSVTLTAAR